MKALTYVIVTGALLGSPFVGRADADQRRDDRSRRAEARTERRADIREDRRDIRQDRRDIREDRRDVREDRRDIRNDRRDIRQDRRDDRYFRDRDIVVLRDYYRPHYRAPRARVVYQRNGYLSDGWARRIRPVPVYIERDLRPVPRGYRRGLIDGYVVVHNDRGFIFDLTAIF